MNEAATEAMVTQGLLNGFPGVDTANHYRNHAGVARGIAAARAAGHTGHVWLQTKMEGCGNSIDERSPILQGSCHEDTLAVFHVSLKELKVTAVTVVTAVTAVTDQGETSHGVTSQCGTSQGNGSNVSRNGSNVSQCDVPHTLF